MRDFLGGPVADSRLPIQGLIPGQGTRSGLDGCFNFPGSSTALNLYITNIKAFCPITSWQTEGGNVEAVTDFIYWSLKSLQKVTVAMKLKDAYSLGGKL